MRELHKLFIKKNKKTQEQPERLWLCSERATPTGNVPVLWKASLPLIFTEQQGKRFPMKQLGGAMFWTLFWLFKPVLVVNKLMMLGLRKACKAWRPTTGNTAVSLFAAICSHSSSLKRVFSKGRWSFNISRKPRMIQEIWSPQISISVVVHSCKFIKTNSIHSVLMKNIHAFQQRRAFCCVFVYSSPLDNVVTCCLC